MIWVKSMFPPGLSFAIRWWSRLGRRPHRPARPRKLWRDAVRWEHNAQNDWAATFVASLRPPKSMVPKQESPPKQTFVGAGGILCRLVEITSDASGPISAVRTLSRGTNSVVCAYATTGSHLHLAVAVDGDAAQHYRADSLAARLLAIAHGDARGDLHLAHGAANRPDALRVLLDAFPHVITSAVID